MPEARANAYRRSHQVVAFIEFAVGVVPVTLVMGLIVVRGLARLAYPDGSDVALVLGIGVLLLGTGGFGVVALWSTVGPVATGAGQRRPLRAWEEWGLAAGCVLAVLLLMLIGAFLSPLAWLHWRLFLAVSAPFIVALHTLSWGSPSEWRRVEAAVGDGVGAAPPTSTPP